MHVVRLIARKINNIHSDHSKTTDHLRLARPKVRTLGLGDCGTQSYSGCDMSSTHTSLHEFIRLRTFCRLQAVEMMRMHSQMMFLY